jgi:hypothetical protein
LQINEKKKSKNERVIKKMESQHRLYKKLKKLQKYYALKQHFYENCE